MRDIHTEIFADDFRDKIFDTDIVAALGQALTDRSCQLRHRDSAVEFFTAAIAQGALHCFCVIRIPKYSQMAFGIRCLTLTLSLHLHMHSVIQILVSEAAQSKFSLLPQLKVHSVVFME